MDKKRIERLIKIADYLDKQNLIEDADLIDNMISENSTTELEIPKDEHEMIKDIFEAFKRNLETE